MESADAKEKAKKEGGGGKPTGKKGEEKEDIWPGTVALREIQKFQNSMSFLIRKLPFMR